MNIHYKHFVFALLLLLTTNIMAMYQRHNYFGGAMQKAREAQHLCNAARTNDQQLLQDFIDLQYDINSQEIVNEYTALHVATEQGHIGITKTLLKHNANTNIQECRGYTPLHMAVKNRDIEFINLLVDHGAHALKDKHDNYPEHYARRYYDGGTPPEGIDIKNDQFAIKSHPALLHARLATLEKGLA